MTDILLEVIRTGVLLVLLLILWRAGKKRAELSREGWRLILGGFCLLLFGAILDVTDNFESLNPYQVIGDTPWEALLEKIVGYLGGFVLLAIGLIRWLPTITGVAEKEQALRDLARVNEELDALNRDLEQRVKERTELQETELCNLRRAEEALRASEEQLQAIADYTYDWESWFAPDGQLKWVNPAVEKLTGYSVEECFEMPEYPLPIVHQEGRDHFRETLQQAVVEKTSVNDLEFRICRKSGQVQWMAASWQPLFNAQGKHIGQRTSFRDITERKRAEEALRTSEQKYKVLFEESADATLIIDKHKFVDCNEAVVEMLRYSSKDKLLKTHPSELSPKTQPDGRLSYEKANEMMTIAYEKGSHRFEWNHKRADGEVFPVEVLLTAIPVEEKKILHVVWRDITERKEAEALREQLIAQLEAQNAELERFTYTVSHDLKSPLITIKGYVGLLQQTLSEGDYKAAVGDLAYVSEAADKMSRLLTDLLELSRIGRLVNKPENVSLDELAREAVDLVSGQTEQRGVHVEISPDLPDVFGDRLRLLEVMQNLIDNAVKYMGDQPDPRVEIGSRREGDETVVYVRDNGIGIDPRYQEKIFGLFDQLDPKVDGSGIGLSLVKRIIEVHGGRIWVESAGAGRGSTFCFTLSAEAEPKEPDGR